MRIQSVFYFYPRQILTKRVKEIEFLTKIRKVFFLYLKKVYQRCELPDFWRREIFQQLKITDSFLYYVLCRKYSKRLYTSEWPIFSNTRINWTTIILVFLIRYRHYALISIVDSIRYNLNKTAHSTNALFLELKKLLIKWKSYGEWDSVVLWIPC